MAVAEMTCGECSAYINLDIENEDEVLSLALRFANQHVACGFMTPPPETPTTPSGQSLRIRKVRVNTEPEDEEDDLE